MKIVNFIILFLSLFVIADTNTEGYYAEIHGNQIYDKRQKEEADELIKKSEQIFSSFYSLADHSNLAIRNIIKLAVKNMRRRGYLKEARLVEDGWKNYDGNLVDIALKKRNIGDFEPISEYLAMAYEIMELTLGYDICWLLRLTDLKTINHGLRVCFRPCQFGYDNFYEHLVHDEKYRGLGPVVAYWSVVIGCSMGTYGIGYFFICSPIGLAVEVGVDRYVAPKMAPKLFNMACNI